MTVVVRVVAIRNHQPKPLLSILTLPRRFCPHVFMGSESLERSVKAIIFNNYSRVCINVFYLQQDGVTRRQKLLDRSFWTLWSCSYMILDSGKLMRQLRSALQRGSGCFAQYSISDGTFLILGGPVSVRRCPYTLRRWDAKAGFGSQLYNLLNIIYLCLIVNGRTAQCHSNFAKKRPNFAVSY